MAAPVLTFLQISGQKVHLSSVLLTDPQSCRKASGDAIINTQMPNSVTLELYNFKESYNR